MSIVIRERAARDIVELTDRFRVDRPRTAIKFTHRLQNAILLLERSPLAGADLGSAESGIRVRFLAVKGFRKYLILHVPLSDGVEIVRVVDGRRNLTALLSGSD